MRVTVKIAVVGLGAIGAQTLWSLSRRSDVEVHGYESGYLGHPFAGAGGEGRLYRKLELTTAGYMPIIQRADELWDELEVASGRRMRRRGGALLLGGAQDAQLVHALDVAARWGVPHEVLDATEVRGRFPQFSIGDDDLGVWDVDAGVIAPERSIVAALELAAAAGARIRENAPVAAVTEDETGVTVHLANGDRAVYDRVVVACGGWTTKLVPGLRDWIVTRRLTSAWFAGRRDGDLAGVPPFMHVAPSYCYGIPNEDGHLLKLGLGFNDHLATGDPDTVPRQLNQADAQAEIDRFAWILRDLLPRLDPHPVRFGTYIESYARSMHEYLGVAPGATDIVALGGFSGHGFKMAPAIGEIGAQLAVGAEPNIDISFLREAPPAFEITDPGTGATTFNAVVASRGTPGSAPAPHPHNTHKEEQ